MVRKLALGFTLESCRVLLALWKDKCRASADVRAIATDHLKEIEVKIAELTTMRDTLNDLMRTCMGNNRPDCPILTSVEGKE